MNCLEFRRHLGSEPGSQRKEFIAHREACPGCSAAQLRADAFESRLLNALRVQAPTNLADRILLAQTTEMRSGDRYRRRRFAMLTLAAAASILIAVVAVNRYDQPVPPLSAMVIEHLQEHVVHADDLAASLPPERVMEAFAERGVKLGSVPAGVDYVHKCPAGPYRTVHMVMPEAEGPITVVYVVDTPPAPGSSFRSGKDFGREVRMGQGSLVMIGPSDRHFESIAASWRDALGNAVAENQAKQIPESLTGELLILQSVITPYDAAGSSACTTCR
ncbi:MAG: DUF3379 family protein [Gammaproteobacteria bacterium]|nr:MAG: DUF3379 family protein [Gammaproteobacteria bacterium]